MPRDYFVGLDHLINDRFDRATEVFAKMAESGGESAEIQFALGSLFRRRGEVERAIRIHTRLREGQPPPVADQASFALALDYLSAGLMDRAEQLLNEVAESDRYRAAALDQLLRVHEQQRDWTGALRIFQRLPAAIQAERRRLAAHYLCELGESALLAGDLPKARQCLEEASSRALPFPRVSKLRAELAEAEGQPALAIERHLETVADAPDLVLESAPRALALVPAAARGALLDRIAGVLAERELTHGQRLIWALAAIVPRAELEGAPTLIGLLQKSLPATRGAPWTSAAAGPLLAADVCAFVGFAHAVQEAAGRYQCGDCGFRSVSWYWQCPGCRSWDAQRPLAIPWADGGARD